MNRTSEPPRARWRVVAQFGDQDLAYAASLHCAGAVLIRCNEPLVWTVYELVGA